MRIDWHQTELRIAVAGKKRWPAGRTAPGNVWGRWVFNHDLWLLYAGRGRLRLHQGWVELERGRALWLRPGWCYDAEQDPDDPLGMYFCHFDLFDAAGRLIPPDGFRLPPEDLGIVDMAFAEPIFSRVADAARGFDWGGEAFIHDKRLQMTHLFTGLLMELDERSETRAATRDTTPHQTRLIQELAHRLSLDPANAPTVAEMAAEMNMSQPHFTRVFKRVCGRSPQQFLIQYRTRHAQRLLAETTLSMREIAERLGYSSAYFFSRQFRQQVGQSPLRFRRKVQATEAG